MEFQFESNITAWDIWKLSMRNIYRSIVGLCNIIFSVAIILLTIKFWGPNQEFLMGLLVLCCVTYPIMQPVMVYLRASKQVAALPKDMIITINETGLHITADNQKAHITWSRVRGVIRNYGMIIIAVEDGRGYMLTDKILGTQKEALLEFLESKIERKA